MRRKEYAVSLGLANAGRGRMSREALDAIEKARSEGMVFDDDGTNEPKSKPVVKVKDKVVSPPVAVAPGGSEHVMGLVFRYDLDAKFTGVDSQGKKHTVSAREVCRNTMVSILGCPCDSHRTLVSSMEVIQVTHKK